LTSKEWEGAEGVYPVLNTALKSVASLRADIALAKNKDDSLFNSELDQEQRDSERYGRSIVVDEEFKYLGPVWGKSFTLYFDILPHRVSTLVRRQLYSLDVFPAKGPTSLGASLKKVDELMKKYGPLLVGDDWRYFINLNQFGGYHKIENMGSFEDEVRAWVSGEITHTAPKPNGCWDEDSFYCLFERNVHAALLTGSSVPRKYMTADEWASGIGNWAGNGATSYKTTLRWNDGREYNIRDNKWSTALVAPTSYVVGCIIGDVDVVQHNKVLPKRELGKVRPVVNGDIEFYWIQAYISHIAEVWMQGSNISPMFMTTAQWYSKRVELCDFSDRSIRVPIDQTHFDWNQTIRMINIVLRQMLVVILPTIPDVSVASDFQKAVRKAIRVFSDPRAHVKIETDDGEKRIYITKGIISGWRWTAFLDTILNYAEVRTAVNIAELVTQTHFNVYSLHMGDDVLMKMDKPGQAAFIVWAMTVSGFPINPTKFFVANDRDEFLRHTYEPGRTTGYLARVIGSLLRRSPIVTDPRDGESRARSLLSNWVKAMNRGAVVDRCIHHACIDISRGTGWSEESVRGWMTTYASLGGGGLLTGSRGLLSWRIKYGTTSVVGDLVGDTPGLSPTLRQVESEGYDFNANAKRELFSQILKLHDSSIKRGDDELVVVVPPEPWHGRLLPVDFGVIDANIEPVVQDRWIGNPLVDGLLSQKLRSKDYDWVHNYYIDQSQREFSVRLEKCRRSVWRLWLERKLFSNPLSPVAGEEAVSVLVKSFQSLVWASISSSCNVTVEKLKAANMLVEDTVRETILCQKVKIGS